MALQLDRARVSGYLATGNRLIIYQEEWAGTAVLLSPGVVGEAQGAMSWLWS